MGKIIGLIPSPVKAPVPTVPMDADKSADKAKTAKPKKSAKTK